MATSTIDSRSALDAVLERELGVCDCSTDDELALLRDVLRLVAERTDAARDDERFRAVSATLRERLAREGGAPLQSYFLHGLERAGFVEHNFNVFDLWLTDRGRWLLAGLDRYAAP